MYGKHFSSMYEGSMIGAGLNVFAVWGYIISHADFNDSCVEIHPKNLALILGCSREEIDKAMEYLLAPDPDSKSKEEDGRRLLKKGEYLYFVVNFKRYRSYKTTSDRRAYNREYMRSYRKDSVKHCNKKFTPGKVYASASVSASDSALNANDKEGNMPMHNATPPAQPEPQGEVAKAGGHPSKGKAGITKPKKASVTVDDATFWAEIAKIYTWIDIAKEKAKMQGWLLVNPTRKFTRRFVNGWLARIEKPLTSPATSTYTPVTPEKMKNFLTH